MASGFDAEPAFVLGAMLPDFAGMIGARIREIDHPRLREGEHHHHRQDHAFHRAPGFRDLVLDGTRWLRSRGVSRGPARGAAHVGVELLFDGALIGEPLRDDAYLAALYEAPGLDDAIVWSRSQAAPRWAQLRTRLREAGLPHALRDPERVCERLVRVLDRRPVLRASAGERDEIACWLRRVQPEVVRGAPGLLGETLAGLETPTPR